MRKRANGFDVGKRKLMFRGVKSRPRRRSIRLLRVVVHAPHLFPEFGRQHPDRSFESRGKCFRRCEPQLVGERLYLRAKEMVYKDSVGVFQGPVYNSFRIEGNKIRLKFKSTGSGLMSKDGKDLRTFEVAGEDGKYVPAKAVIEGNDVLVWSDAVKKPLSARHAWDSNPAVNLYNKEGLPATSFRTNKEL